MRYLINDVPNVLFVYHYFAITPWGPGGLSRERVLRIPMCVVKGD